MFTNCVRGSKRRLLHPSRGFCGRVGCPDTVVTCSASNGSRVRMQSMPGALPSFLKVWWISSSPFAFLFAARILWEKTIWTWSRGPQMVGFALWHIHPGFAVAGTLASLAIVLWLLIAVPVAIARRHDIEPSDWLMMAGSVLVIAILAVPDTFFATPA